MKSFRAMLKGYFLLVCLLLAPSVTFASGWQTLEPGMELGKFTVKHPMHHVKSTITILRIDPNLWDLNFVGASQTKGSNGRTAKQWSYSNQFSAAINAGMFGTDNKTHIGYLRSNDHVNNSHVNSYQSVAAFSPKHDGIPPFHIFDLDDAGVSMKTILRNYRSAVQNLRLIKHPGENRWDQQKKMWSEAALGEDNQGRILFIFCRLPFTMHDLNDELLGLNIGLVSAQHLEGGPEAQLYIHAGKTELEMFGSYETAFKENNGNSIPWPVPNVLGVKRRQSLTHK